MLYRIQPRLWEQTLTDEGEPVLLCRSRLPECSALEERVLRRINGYYVHVGKGFRRWCMGSLLPACRARRRTARERSRPFEPWAPVLDYEVLDQESGETLTIRLLLSGEGVNRVESTARWSLRDGFMLSGNQGKE